MTTTLNMLYEIRNVIEKLAAMTTEDGYYDKTDELKKENAGCNADQCYDAYVTMLRDELSAKLAALTAHSPSCALLEVFTNQTYCELGRFGNDPLDAVLFRPSASFPMDRHDQHRLWAWYSVWEAAVTIAKQEAAMVVKKEEESYIPINRFTFVNSMYPRDYDWGSVDDEAPMPPPIPYDNRKRLHSVHHLPHQSLLGESYHSLCRPGHQKRRGRSGGGVFSPANCSRRSARTTGSAQA